MPVITSALVPPGVAADVVTVSVELLPEGFGENSAVAPAGSPLTLRFTSDVNPPLGLMDTAYVVDCPGPMLRVAGATASAKSGALTVRLTVAVRVVEPLTPVMVRTLVPEGVPAPVVTCSVDVLEAGLGVNCAVAPAGNPLTLKLTSPENPAKGVTVTG